MLIIKRSFFRSLSVHTVTFCAVMIALQVVFSRFIAINTGIIRFSFGFIPAVLAAVCYGIPVCAAVCAAGDVLGAVLFPSGAYFPGFTLTAILMGISYGLFLKNLHESKISAAIGKTAACVFINEFILSLFLNTFWLTVITGSGFAVIFTERLISSSVDFAVQTATVIILYKTGFLRTFARRITRR